MNEKVISDGGPAFPALHTIDGNWVKEPLAEHSGMSLRDFFAAKAMQSLIALNGFNNTLQTTAEQSYWFADAMLKARQP